MTVFVITFLCSIDSVQRDPKVFSSEALALDYVSNKLPAILSLRRGYRISLVPTERSYGTEWTGVGTFGDRAVSVGIRVNLTSSTMEVQS
jgi:hypothetical protein